MSDYKPLPDTVAELQALVLAQQASLLEQQASIANMVREIAARDDEIERLKAQIDKLRRMYFGSKSEQLARQIDKLEAQLEDLTAGRGALEARSQRDKTSAPPVDKSCAREPLPPHLPREKIELKPDSACPRCATTMQLLGEDVSEQLARVAAVFKVIRTIRHKLLCPDCGHIEQPAMPSLPIERSIAHPSLLADIAVSKFADHQPLYRQSEIAARDGVSLDRASMGRWIGQIAELCGPLVEAINHAARNGSGELVESSCQLRRNQETYPAYRAQGNRRYETGQHHPDAPALAGRGSHRA